MFNVLCNNSSKYLLACFVFVLVFFFEDRYFESMKNCLFTFFKFTDLVLVNKPDSPKTLILNFIFVIVMIVMNFEKL